MDDDEVVEAYPASEAAYLPLALVHLEHPQTIDEVDPLDSMDFVRLIIFLPHFRVFPLWRLS